MGWTITRGGVSCPFCRAEVTEFRRLSGVVVSIRSWAQVTQEARGIYVQCTGCGRDVMRPDGVRIEPGELRKSQIRAVDANGRELYVHYGPTKGLKARLKEQRIRWPDGFRGDGVRLARVMRMSISDLASEFEMSPGEFGTTMFDIGDTFLDKA